MMVDLPPPTRKPCNECPWRRSATRGYVGPESPMAWIGMAHADIPIACHETIDPEREGDVSYSHQCAGAAIFRANVHKLPRNPQVQTLPADRDRVFASNEEFLDHHDIRPRMMRLRKWMLEEWSGMSSHYSKRRMVQEIVSYGAATHFATLLHYEELLDAES